MPIIIHIAATASNARIIGTFFRTIMLKYCTDLRALDIGHQAITDLSVIGEHLTELRVLIIADNKVTDLTPLSNLRHLHYLEFFVNRVSDLSPLAE